MWATLLQVQTPDCAWCRHTSTNHPNVGIKVTGYYARPNGRALEVVELSGAGWSKAAEDIQKLPSVDEMEILETTPELGRIRVAGSECALPAAIEASGIVPQLPFEVALGCDKWLLISAQERAKQFYDNLVGNGVQVEVIYSGEYAPEAKLTPRQQEVLHRAIEAGYYDYPRRITLTHLAEEIGVAKSTLSQTLMLVESEVVKRAATGRASAPRS